jgi:hypothetical protein
MNNVTISTSDLVNMLVEERKNEINIEIERLKQERLEFIEETENNLCRIVLRFYEDNKETLDTIQNALTTLISLEDSKAVVRLLNENEIKGHIRYWNIYNESKEFFIVFVVKCSKSIPSFNLNRYYNGMDELKGESVFPVNMKVQLGPINKERLTTLDTKIKELENILKDTKGLKSELSAKLTRQMINENPEFTLLKSNIKLLSNEN